MYGSDIDGWQFVFWGGDCDCDCDWKQEIEATVQAIESEDERAHHIFSHEVDGPRMSLLLVHYSPSERDEIAARLSRHWTFSFVNAVIDITEHNAHND
jgi:hypothetical protein